MSAQRRSLQQPFVGTAHFASFDRASEITFEVFCIFRMKRRTFIVFGELLAIWSFLRSRLLSLLPFCSVKVWTILLARSCQVLWADHLGACSATFGTVSFQSILQRALFLSLSLFIPMIVKRVLGRLITSTCFNSTEFGCWSEGCSFYFFFCILLEVYLSGVFATVRLRKIDEVERFRQHMDTQTEEREECVLESLCFDEWFDPEGRFIDRRCDCFRIQIAMRKCGKTRQGPGGKHLWSRGSHLTKLAHPR